MGGSKPRTYFSELTIFKAVLYTVATVYVSLVMLVAFAEVCKCLVSRTEIWNEESDLSSLLVSTNSPFLNFLVRNNSPN